MVDSVRIPPDSTGKKIGTEERRVLEYDNLTGSFNIGDTVTGQITGATGVITGIVTEGYAANSGRLYLSNATLNFEDDENLQVAAVTQAVANFTTQAEEDINFQNFVLTDPDNPRNQQKVDDFGATLNTFTDGSPVFTPFGAMAVGQQQTIKDYRFAYGERAEMFYDQETSGATIAWETNTTAVLFSTPTTTGALAQRTSHFYHPYTPGVGSIVEISIDIGDAGKANVRRRWGLFDDNNGVYWELDGTTLYAVVRSKTSGSVVNTRVAQASFNKDRLDGSNSIGFDLDVTQGNIYFIDYQWLGAGRVRFGVLAPDGSRLNAHIFEHANTLSSPYMQTGTLPIRLEQENTGTAGSTSEMRWVCGTVKHTSMTAITTEKRSYFSGLKSKADTDGEDPIVSFRPQTTINSVTNRAIARFESISLVNDGTEPAIFRIYMDGTLTAASYANITGSILQGDTSATAISGGTLLWQDILAPNESRTLQQIQDVRIHEYELYMNADGTTQPEFQITAEVLTTGTNNVGAILNWGEIVL